MAMHNKFLAQALATPDCSGKTTSVEGLGLYLGLRLARGRLELRGGGFVVVVDRGG